MACRAAENVITFRYRAVRAGERARAIAADVAIHPILASALPRPRDPTGPAWRVVKVHQLGQEPRWLLRTNGGGAAGIRTPDLRRARAALSRLSYGPPLAPGPTGVGAPGLEPGTSALSGPRSNHLSYAPAARAMPTGMSRDGRCYPDCPQRQEIPALYPRRSARENFTNSTVIRAWRLRPSRPRWRPCQILQPRQGEDLGARCPPGTDHQVQA
jgi:hypothetical protein